MSSPFDLLQASHLSLHSQVSVPFEHLAKWVPPGWPAGQRQVRTCVSHTHTHTNTNIHIQQQRAWMVIQLQPAVWKQVKGRKRRRKKGEDEGWSLGPKETWWARLSSSLSWWAPQANILWMRAYFGGLHFPFYPVKKEEEVEERWLIHDVIHRWKILNESQYVIEDVNFGLLLGLVLLLLYDSTSPF